MNEIQKRRDGINALCNKFVQRLMEHELQLSPGEVLGILETIKASFVGAMIRGYIDDESKEGMAASSSASK